MAADDGAPRPLTGEILPRTDAEALSPANRPVGTPLFNRLRYRAVQKELDAYLAVVQAKNAVLRELTETVRISEDYDRALVRTSRLDDLRRIEGLRIDAEMGAALETALAERDAAQINAFARRARKAEAEAAALAAEQRLAAMKNPGPPPAPPPSPADRVKAEIAKLRRMEAELIAAIVAAAGGEASLTEDDHDVINNIRLTTRDRIANLMQEMFA